MNMDSSEPVRKRQWSLAVADIDCILHLRALPVSPNVWFWMTEKRDTFQPAKETRFQWKCNFRENKMRFSDKSDIAIYLDQSQCKLCTHLWWVRENPWDILRIRPVNILIIRPRHWMGGNFRADNKSKYLFTIAVYRKGVSKRLAHFGIPFSTWVLPSAIFISVVVVLCLGFSCFLDGLVVGWLGGWMVGWCPHVA